MALVTTVGGASSDSYVTAAEWETYVAANITQTTLGGHGHEASHEMNLRRAAQWLSQLNWVGYKQYETQALAWPRITSKLVDGWSIDIDAIPQAVKDAQCELAYLMHEGADPWATVSGGTVRRKRSKAGPVETETEYADVFTSPRYVGVMAMLKPYLRAGIGQVRALRG